MELTNRDTSRDCPPVLIQEDPVTSPRSRLVVYCRLLVTASLVAALTACTTTVTRMPAGSGFSNLIPAEELPQKGQQDPASLIARGESLLASGQGQLATTLFVQALQQEPENLTAASGLGNALLASGRYQAAGKVFERILQDRPDDLFALRGAVRACRSGGNLEKARSYLKQALALAPDDPHLLCEQAGFYQDRGEPGKAEPLYRRIVQLQADDAAAYNNLGFNRILLGEYADAIASLSRALALEPKNQRIKNNLAVAWALGGREEVAYNLFRDGLGEAAAWNNVGFLLAARGEWQGATSSLQRAMDSNPVFYPRASDNLEQIRRLAAGHGQ